MLEICNMTKKYPKSFKGRKLNTLELKIIVNRELKNLNGKSYSAAGLIKKLKISNNRDEVQLILEKLVKEGRVRQTTGGVYQSNNKSSIPEKLFYWKGGFDSFWSRLYNSRRKIR